MREKVPCTHILKHSRQAKKRKEKERQKANLNHLIKPPNQIYQKEPPPNTGLKVLLPKEELRPLRTRILIRHRMERPRKHTRPTKKHTHIRLGMLLRNRREHPIPIRPPKMRRRPQPANRILLAPHIVHHDIRRVVLLDLRGEVDRDLDPAHRVLLFDRLEERVEPFGGPKVPDDPCEVHLGETRGFGVVHVVHPVPDAFEDGRERSDADTRTDEEHGFVFQEILRRRAERTVDHHAREDTVHRRWDHFAFSTALLLFRIEITSKRFRQRARKVTNDTNVHGDVILLWGAGECERVPLPVGDLGALEEDVLACTGCGFLFLDLDLHHLGGVLDDLGDVGTVTRADFAEDTFVDPDHAAYQPVALHNEGKKISKRKKI